MNALKLELETATCFSLMMDEASDYGHIEQVLIVVHYIDSAYVIQERMLHVESTDSTEAKVLFQILLSSLSLISLSADKLIGQCYDGASNMRGAISGLQAKVKALQPKAVYSHCYAHCVNLVIVEATSSNHYARKFFGILQNLYCFLEASPHRHAKLHSIILQVMSKPRVKSLKKLSDTWWSCRSDAILAVFENYIAVVKSFEEIEEDSCNGRIASEANGLINQLTTFEFILCLIVMKDLLVKSRTVSDYLQKDVDIISTMQVADTTVKTFKEMRTATQFKKFYDEAKKLAYDLPIDIQEMQPRVRKISRRLDDNSQTQHLITDRREVSHYLFL